MRRLLSFVGLISVLAWPVPFVAQTAPAGGQTAPAQPGTGPAPAQPGTGQAPGGGFRGRGGPPRPANQPSPRDDARHKAFVERAQAGNIDLLFVGDSITDWWARGGLEVWNANFASMNPANVGIAGDTTQGVLWRMQNGELEGFKAKLIVLMLGTNNINRNPVDEIVDGNRLIIEEFKARQPQAKVLLLGVFPRTANADNPIRATIKEMNAKLAKLADNRQVFFKDIGEKFLAPDGSLPADVMPDGLHPNAKGYQIWADAIRDDVKQLMQTGTLARAIATPGAQQGPAPAPPAPAAAADGWTTAQDHQQMMAQLGITKLRPGPSGNENAPNAANYDEALANPFPKLPEVLTLKNGRKVTSADAWRTQRRPEIVEDFEREVLGRVPKNVPKVTWTVIETARGTVGDRPVVGKVLAGRVDNSAHPAISVEIQMTLVTPADAKGPVPVMMMFGGARSIPGGTQPPAPQGRGGGPRAGGPPPGAAPAPPSDPPATQQLIAAGWGYAQINPASIQADNGAGLTKGIIGLTNKGQPRKPDDWGSLRAWAWGASRGLDYLETDKTADAKRVGIEGVSRYGKAALVTMAFDQRFAVVLVGSSGEGGAKLHRRNFGEAVENLTGSGEYHWMAGNFLKYGAAEATFGSRNAGDIPVDAHQLIALCAPRLTFISYGVPERGDAKWLDQQGSFMAAVAAGPVFRLLGARDLGRSDDYNRERMPAVNVGLLDGQLAWRQHDGGHTDGPNWKYFIPWASGFLKYRP